MAVRMFPAPASFLVYEKIQTRVIPKLILLWDVVHILMTLERNILQRTCSRCYYRRAGLMKAGGLVGRKVAEGVRKDPQKRGRTCHRGGDGVRSLRYFYENVYFYYETVPTLASFYSTEFAIFDGFSRFFPGNTYLERTR